MKTIMKKIDVYEFEELDKKIQDNITDFKLKTMFPLKEYGKIVSNDKIFFKVANSILKDCSRFLYLKNGTHYGPLKKEKNNV